MSRSCLVWTADVDTDARGVMRCAFWRRMHRPSSLPRPPATGTRNGTEVGLVSHTGEQKAAQSGTMHGSSRAAAGACAVRERGRMCLYMRAREHCPSHAGRSGPRTRADAVVVASAFARLNGLAELPDVTPYEAGDGNSRGAVGSLNDGAKG